MKATYRAVTLRPTRENEQEVNHETNMGGSPDHRPKNTVNKSMVKLNPLKGCLDWPVVNNWFATNESTDKAITTWPARNCTVAAREPNMIDWSCSCHSRGSISRDFSIRCGVRNWHAARDPFGLKAISITYNDIRILQDRKVDSITLSSTFFPTSSTFGGVDCKNAHSSTIMLNVD